MKPARCYKNNIHTNLVMDLRISLISQLTHFSPDKGWQTLKWQFFLKKGCISSSWQLDFNLYLCKRLQLGDNGWTDWHWLTHWQLMKRVYRRFKGLCHSLILFSEQRWWLQRWPVSSPAILFACCRGLSWIYGVLRW